MATEENKDPLAFDENVDPHYKKGFEHGYWLTKSKSIEYDGILKRNYTKASYKAGLVAGNIQVKREWAQERISKVNRQNEINRDKDREIE